MNSKPGFEFIFALSLIAILGLPPILKAQTQVQTQKDLEINIIDGDTVVNGKKLKDLSPTDRQTALKDINTIDNKMAMAGNDKNGDKTKRLFTYKRRDSLYGKDGHHHMMAESFIIKDSMGNVVAVKPGNLKNRAMMRDRMRGNETMNFGDRNFDHPYNSARMGFERRNSQNFDYISTDDDGVSTHIRFHISEASNEDLKRMPHVEGAKFEVEDLNIVPEFKTGKTLLMFSLPSKTMALVKLHDSDGKLVWEEKATGGNFKKTFVMGLNGVYYLQVKQGNSVLVKKIMKEE